MDITYLPAKQLQEMVVSKKISVTEIIQTFLRRIDALDPQIKAFITVFRDTVLNQASQIDKKIAAGKTMGALAGVPIAVKDNICIAGTPTTCASKILKNYRATYDGHIIQKLKTADALIIGKTNMDEFAMGSSTENSAFFTTRNPWNTECIPGGSSGGSAAAVAAGMVPIAIGSDTGGSIRQPASLCGVVGMKPTYGRVSRYGLIAFGSSLDQIGPLSRDVEDTAMLLNVIAGHDACDATSFNEPIPDYSALIHEKKTFTIGLPKEYFEEGLDTEIRNAVEQAVNVFKKMGWPVREIALPHTKYAVAVYYIIAPSEASANLARYDGVKYGYRTQSAKSLLDNYEYTRKEGFGDEVKRRIMLGTYALSAGYYDAYYAQAQKVQRLIQNDFTEAFKQVDLIVTPAAPTPAFKIGEKSSDPLQMYLSDIFTISCNLAGIPGISIPCGFSRQKLPIGMQILGPLKKDETVLQSAYAFQQATAFHKEKPKI